MAERGRWWVWVAPAVCVVLGVAGWLAGAHLGVDSAVYRAGGAALLHGEPLYARMSLAAEPDWAGLPFTYPPTAALFFVPMALVPTQVAWGLLGALSLLALAVVVKVCVDALPSRPQWMGSWKALAGLGIAFLVLEPVWRSVALGQINLVLMALVVVDVLVLGARGSRAGGVLVGVAAAVKLTPLVFVGHLLLLKRWADAARAVGVFLGLQLLMFLVARQDVVDYWGSAVQDPDRVGPVYWAGNQSLNGLVLRLFDGAEWSEVAVAVVALVLVVPCALLVRRSPALPALLVSAFFGLLISPVSWSHHWVWAVPLLVLLLGRVRSPRDAWAPALVAAVFASCVLIFMRNGHAQEFVEFEWTPWEYAIGSAYLLVPAVVGLTLLVRAVRARREPAGAAG
ncbi:glycosyltransferase 87 family protein [Actinokineospora bangkokensis]|uniref:glycosyltransferase 87 family protein n=1 Tax=Actinokineospora bangkokensis TaxID=1193682 RepID=UPI001E2B864B|nr:glycosyltransferase 87 family protein [Actinokineospora bangkokensis]